MIPNLTHVQRNRLYMGTNNVFCRYGNPVSCQDCKRFCAFAKGKEVMQKVGGLVLCFLCTRNHKRKMKSKEKEDRQQTKRSLDNFILNQQDEMSPHKKQHSDVSSPTTQLIPVEGETWVERETEYKKQVEEHLASLDEADRKLHELYQVVETHKKTIAQKDRDAVDFGLRLSNLEKETNMRISELEKDLQSRNEDIKKLQQELFDLRQECQFLKHKPNGNVSGNSNNTGDVESNNTADNDSSKDRDNIKNREDSSSKDENKDIDNSNKGRDNGDRNSDNNSRDDKDNNNRNRNNRGDRYYSRGRNRDRDRRSRSRDRHRRSKERVGESRDRYGRDRDKGGERDGGRESSNNSSESKVGDRGNRDKDNKKGVDKNNDGEKNRVNDKERDGNNEREKGTSNNKEVDCDKGVENGNNGKEIEKNEEKGKEYTPYSPSYDSP